MVTKFRPIENQGYFLFDVGKLIIGSTIPFDVHMKQGGMFELLFEFGTEYTALTRDYLIQRGLKELYVTDEDKPVLESYMSKGFSGSTSILESSKAFKDYTFHKDQYYQIDRQMLIPGSEVNFSIYVMKNFAYLQLLHATGENAATLTEKVLESKGDLLIPSADIPRYNEYIGSLLRSDSVKGKGAGKFRALLIKENSKIIVRDLFENPRSGEKIKQTKTMVDGMIESIMANRDNIYDLLSLRGYDYYTYTHSVNVCVLSVGLGVAVNLNQTEIEMLGVGSMLHDIGKSVIPAEIVNKQGKLDDTEYRIIQSHVYEGEKILKDNHSLSADSLNAVTQHHEKISGRGYPRRLKANEISFFGRITAIADCYDALTTTRPYRQSLSPFMALGIIARETGNFDPELLLMFVKMLGKI